MELQEIQQQMRQAFTEYLEIANLKPGQIIVIGCSTSEVHGGRIGKDSQPDIAEALYQVWLQWQKKKACIWHSSAASI